MPPSSGPDGDRPSDASRGFLHDRREGYGRAVRVGLAISLVVHLVALLVIARSLRIDSPAARAPAERTVEMQGPLAIEVGRVRPASEEPEEDDAVRPPEEMPAERQRPLETPQGPPVVAEGDADADGDAEYLTNAERLQPQEGDERLWQEYDEDEIPIYLAENPYARYEGEIRARLSVILDSLALTEEQRRRATEWLTGEDGGEWGVSEEGIHLGGIVIPINLGSLLAEEGPRGRESRQRARDLGDIQYQDMIGEAEDIRRDRARQMRERTKEELEQRLRDSLGVAADSTEDAEEGR